MKLQKIISCLVVFILLLSTLVFSSPDIELAARSAILIYKNESRRDYVLIN